MSKFQSNSSNFFNTSFFLILLPVLVSSTCTCIQKQDEDRNQSKQLIIYKIVAIVSVLVSGALGVCLPFLVKINIPFLHPDNDFYLLIKAFAAGVILATGFVHVLPDAQESLASPCLSQKPWGKFPFTGFVAMVSAIGTLMMEALATGYKKRSALSKPQPLDGDEEAHHVHGSALVLESSNSSDRIRNRIISQVLELGIIVHSVIIGVSLGACQNLHTIKPLVAALSFHQFFEGIGLGGCIYQKAKFSHKTMAVMVGFFSMTSPCGIGVGMAISNTYNENSPTSLVVEGLLLSASAGILIYMALVDLLAADFINNAKLISNPKLQLGANFTLLLGAGFMSLLAKLGD
ncbi:putative zinc/iron permease [Rosa chinensis]|uniref:Putative zinc/iron permease n=1 Tax=Rosa chinensis TaxID=74649 RepID=A0A2P6Q7E6_ROSCH|nr:putative zinc/iron permease [Rosa chinensis]